MVEIAYEKGGSIVRQEGCASHGTRQFSRPDFPPAFSLYSIDVVIERRDIKHIGRDQRSTPNTVLRGELPADGRCLNRSPCLIRLVHTPDPIQLIQTEGKKLISGRGGKDSVSQQNGAANIPAGCPVKAPLDGQRLPINAVKHAVVPTQNQQAIGHGRGSIVAWVLGVHDTGELPLYPLQAGFNGKHLLPKSQVSQFAVNQHAWPAG